jgi:ubiquinone/menaquinone biosynthesis C-methylase UbiE
MLRRFLARQFARPRGLAGRWLIAPWLNRISRTMNSLVLHELRVGPQDDVLEVGFGGGGLLAMLLARTRGRVFGVDVSEAMVMRAQRRFRKEARLSVQAGSVEKLPLEDASVDRAASVNNLYFWADPKAALAELARVIRPGGRLAIAFEPPEELRKWPGHRYGFRLHRPADVFLRMRQAGFIRIRETEGRGRKPDRFFVLTGERGGAEPKT